MTGLERNSEVVQMAAYAPLFVHANFVKWPTNLIVIDNHRWAVMLEFVTFAPSSMPRCNHPNDGAHDGSAPACPARGRLLHVSLGTVHTSPARACRVHALQSRLMHTGRCHSISHCVDAAWPLHRSWLVKPLQVVRHRLLPRAEAVQRAPGRAVPGNRSADPGDPAAHCRQRNVRRR